VATLIKRLGDGAVSVGFDDPEITFTAFVNSPPSFSERRLSPDISITTLAVV